MDAVRHGGLYSAAMETLDVLITMGLSFLPISELRGGIPYALAHGASWWSAWLLCVGCNALVAPLVWIFLGTVHKLFMHMKWYARLFERVVERTRHKIGAQVDRWGWIGIGLFVAVPLPITGAWTGTLGAWLLGVSKRKTFLAVVVGVIISGTIVTSVVVFGVKALEIFTKSGV